MLDQIHLSDLRVDCVVGLFPHERDTLQPLEVDITLWLDTTRAARSERLRDTVHYGLIASQIRFLLTSCRFRLLETAGEALTRLLLSPPAPGERRAQIERARIRLTKPQALEGMAIPALELERVADDVQLTHERKPFGRVDVLMETRDAGIYRLNVAPGKGIPQHVHRVMHESEMILSDGILCQGKPVKAGSVFRWPHEAKHRYDNPTGRDQTILCVDSPRFMPADEIPVEGEPAAVAPEP